MSTEDREMSITSNEYWKEIESIAAYLIEENKNDNSRVYEVVDGHQWIIYCRYNLDVIQHSDNEDYIQDNLGGEFLVQALKLGGLKGLHQAIAHHAMLADVQEKLNNLELD